MTTRAIKRSISAYLLPGIQYWTFNLKSIIFIQTVETRISLQLKDDDDDDDEMAT